MKVYLATINGEGQTSDFHGVGRKPLDSRLYTQEEKERKEEGLEIQYRFKGLEWVEFECSEELLKQNKNLSVIVVSYPAESYGSAEYIAQPEQPKLYAPGELKSDLKSYEGVNVAEGYETFTTWELASPLYTLNKDIQNLTQTEIEKIREVALEPLVSVVQEYGEDIGTYNGSIGGFEYSYDAQEGKRKEGQIRILKGIVLNPALVLAAKRMELPEAFWKEVESIVNERNLSESELQENKYGITPATIEERLETVTTLDAMKKVIDEIGRQEADKSREGK